MITFHFEINCRPNKQGRYVIFLRITDTDSKKMKRTKSTIDLARPSDWNKDKERIRTSERNAELWNQVLDAELEKAKHTYRKLSSEGIATASQIVSQIKGTGKKHTLLAFAKQQHDAIKAEGRLGSWQKYGNTIKNLEAFLTDNRGNVNDVLFAEVGTSFIEDFAAFLRKQPNAKQPAKDDQPAGTLHPNTISKHLRCLRAILNKAISEKLMKPEDNPFHTYKIREIKVVKEKLSANEIKALEDVDLAEYSLPWHARNAFLLSFYCAGIRAGDVIQLRWNNITPEGRLVYRMGKNSKLKDVLLVPQAKAILEKYAKEGIKPNDYIFPYLDNRAKYAKYAAEDEKASMPLPLKEQLFREVNAREVSLNNQLRKAAAAAGIEKHISFHISRHTFAKQAKLAGTDNELLKDLMAHSSLATTERYMKDFDTSREDKALEDIFEAGNSNKPTEAELLAALRSLDKEQLAALLKNI